MRKEAPNNYCTRLATPRGTSGGCRRSAYPQYGSLLRPPPALARVSPTVRSNYSALPKFVEGEAVAIGGPPRAHLYMVYVYPSRYLLHGGNQTLPWWQTHLPPVDGGIMIESLICGVLGMAFSDQPGSFSGMTLVLSVPYHPEKRFGEGLEGEDAVRILDSRRRVPCDAVCTKRQVGEESASGI